MPHSTPPTPDHAHCAALLRDATEDLVVPMLMLAELDYWCHERLDVNAWLVFLDDLLEGVYRSETPTPGDLARCRQLQTTYANLGVVDASVVALVERLEETKVATLDHRPDRVRQDRGEQQTPVRRPTARAAKT